MLSECARDVQTPAGGLERLHAVAHAGKRRGYNPPMSSIKPAVLVELPGAWPDYELLDSGDGCKLERFADRLLIRPEKAALWRRALPPQEWLAADAEYVSQAGGNGSWRLSHPQSDRWQMRYGGLRYVCYLSPFRHTGVFPEQAPQWHWLDQALLLHRRPARVLNLFAYTGIATLVAAARGASVSHVDASRPSIAWAQENATASGLRDRPIRWLLDDSLKFVQRELRRQASYDGIVLDPPPFGRGPSGQLWRFESSFPLLLQECGRLLSPQARFLLVTAYAIEDSALTLANLLAETLAGRGGTIECGELALCDRAGRLLSLAIFARWLRRD